MISYSEVPIQEVKADWLTPSQIRLLVRREDLNHPLVSGNKWWKLKYNLKAAKEAGHKTLLTFGGAYSNHIFATAAAAKEEGFKSIGVIRGEETLPLNPTLSFAKHRGMKLHYVSRAAYRLKDDPAFMDELKKEFGEFYLIPEGGTNALAVKGCSELGAKLSETQFDYLCLPVGTGGTLAGIASGLEGSGSIIGFSTLKDGHFLNDAVEVLINDCNSKSYHNWKIETAFHFGGYAKTTTELQRFIKEFQTNHSIPLEAVYTGKMMFGIREMVKAGYFRKGSTIMAVHTGGLASNIFST